MKYIILGCIIILTIYNRCCYAQDSKAQVVLEYLTNNPKYFTKIVCLDRKKKCPLYSNSKKIFLYDLAKDGYLIDSKVFYSKLDSSSSLDNEILTELKKDKKYCAVFDSLFYKKNVTDTNSLYVIRFYQYSKNLIRMEIHSFGGQTEKGSWGSPLSSQAIFLFYIDDRNEVKRILHFAPKR